MPGRFLTDADRDRLSRFPTQLSADDLSTYFTLTESDRVLLHAQRGDHNRMGVAVQLGALRLMGFCPDQLADTPPLIVAYVAQQLDADPAMLQVYGQRPQTRTDHLQQVQRHLRWRDMTAVDLAALTTWLVEQAQEHDKPMVLLHLATEKLYRDKLVRPGITILERLIIHARFEVHTVTYHTLLPLLTPEIRAYLDQLLVPDPTTGRTPLTWLRQSTVTNSPASIRTTINKLATLRAWGVPAWEVQTIHPKPPQISGPSGLQIECAGAAARRPRTSVPHPDRRAHAGLGRKLRMKPSISLLRAWLMPNDVPAENGKRYKSPSQAQPMTNFTSCTS